MTETRVRFAPSPTGFLHVGGLRTALFNYLFAKNQKGKLILRIEDTDQSRKVEGAVENLIESLRWAGIEFDEGPGIGGDKGPYFQSERLAIYKEHIDRLLEQGDAYPCFCTEDELKTMREEQVQKKQPTRYDGRCRRLKKEEVEQKMAENTPHVVRMKIIHSKGNYRVEDMVRGFVSFKPSQIDDQVILKSDGFPTYHLANVVDDHLMGITHVIRGEEWLPSTPKHTQLYEYFGWEPPKFAHLPLLLNPDRSKLSKRQGDVATEDFKNKGFLPECMINFVALLGWNTADTKEIFSLDELIQEFSMERVGKAGAVFDVSKLRWMNQQYIKQLSLEELFEAVQPYFPEETKQTEESKLKKMVEIVRDSLCTLPEIDEKLQLFFLDKPELEEDLLAKVQAEDAQTVFKAFLGQAKNAEQLDSATFMSLMKEVQKETGIKGKNLWISMRIAVTLVEQGPELPLVVEILGRDKVVHRIESLLV